MQNNLQIHTENYNQYIKRIIEINKRHQEMVVRFDELLVKLTPVMENFSGLSWSGKMIWKVLAIFGSIIALALGIKQLLS